MVTVPSPAPLHDTFAFVIFAAVNTAGSVTVTVLDAAEIQPLASWVTTEYVLGPRPVNVVLL